MQALSARSVDKDDAPRGDCGGEKVLRCERTGRRDKKCGKGEDSTLRCQIDWVGATRGSMHDVLESKAKAIQIGRGCCGT